MSSLFHFMSHLTSTKTIFPVNRYCKNTMKNCVHNPVYNYHFFNFFCTRVISLYYKQLFLNCTRVLLSCPVYNYTEKAVFARFTGKEVKKENKLSEKGKK